MTLIAKDHHPHLSIFSLSVSLFIFVSRGISLYITSIETRSQRHSEPRSESRRTHARPHRPVSRSDVFETVSIVANERVFLNNPARAFHIYTLEWQINDTANNSMALAQQSVLPSNLRIRQRLISTNWTPNSCTPIYSKKSYWI